MSIFLGSTEIGSVKLGSQQVQAVYQGANPIWTAFSYDVGGSGARISNSAQHTSPNLSLGAYPTKVVAVFYDSAGTQGASITSATIAGQACTVYQTIRTGLWEQCAILVLTGSAATSGTVVLNFSTTLGTYGAPYYGQTGFQAYSTTGTVQNVQADTTLATKVFNVNASNNNSLIVASVGRGSTGLPTMSGTGVIRNYTLNDTNGIAGAAGHANSLAAQTFTISAGSTSSTGKIVELW